MGHHAYDKAQSVCGLPVGRRGNGGLLMLRPDLHQFADALIHVQRGLACGKPSPAAAAAVAAAAAGTSGVGGSIGGSVGGGAVAAVHANATALLAAIRRSANETASAAGAEQRSFADVARLVQQALRRAQLLERLLLDPRGIELNPRPPPPPANATTASNASSDVLGDGNETEGGGGGRELVNAETGLSFVELRRRLLERPCFREEQTGLACLFNAHRRLRILPCPYSWDVGNGLHMHGKQHHAGCLTKSGTDEATCNRIAHHVAAHCTWDHASRGSHIIHYTIDNFSRIRRFFFCKSISDFIWRSNECFFCRPIISCRSIRGFIYL